MQKSSAAAAQALFSLIDSPWQSHLKFDGRAPRTLEELAIAKADNDHRCRLAEIKRIRGKLALLDPFLPKLAELGMTFGYRDFTTWTMDGKTLRLFPSMGDKWQDGKLHAALLELGFKEVQRKEWARGVDQVHMKHGRLVLVLDVAAADATPAVSTASEAVGEAIPATLVMVPAAEMDRLDAMQVKLQAGEALTKAEQVDHDAIAQRALPTGQSEPKDSTS